MFRIVRILAGVGMALAMVVWTAERPATAITAQLAKQCRGLAIKAHPYKLVGEKGPGSAQAQRAYFNECVANGGEMPAGAAGDDRGKNGQGSAPPTSAK